MIYLYIYIYCSLYVVKLLFECICLHIIIIQFHGDIRLYEGRLQDLDDCFAIISVFLKLNHHKRF